MTVRLQLRGDTVAAWALVNPILAERELGLETDTMLYKIGDGITAWNALPHRDLSGVFLALALQVSGEPPSPPPPGELALFATNTAGRAMLGMVGPSGLDVHLQPIFAKNKIGLWLPPGNAATVPGVLAYTAPTASGTATQRDVTVANMFQRMRRLGYVGTAVAGQIVGQRVAAAQITTGDGNSLGGFFKVCRFGISDPAPIADARMFVGISNATAAPTNVEPSTLTQCIGVGCGAADTNLKLFYGGSVAQQPIDLGANFPANTGAIDVYELSLFSPASVDSKVFWEVRRLNTGHKAGGVIEDSSGITIPSSAVLLSYHRAWRTNNASALIPALDIMSDYIETDY